jgi:NAD(P)-dependent dehydrogenase (short-subunit alcohol dehydrogenase family)
MLKNKVAVIYGAGGGIGSAVARAFANEGAKVFLTGLHGAAVEAVAKGIVAAGGSAEAAEVDALDEQAIDRHLQSVIDKAGRIDISFNAIAIPDAKLLAVRAGTTQNARARTRCAAKRSGDDPQASRASKPPD